MDQTEGPGDRIAQALKAAGLRAADLARRAKVSPPTVRYSLDSDFVTIRGHRSSLPPVENPFQNCIRTQNQALVTTGWNFGEGQLVLSILYVGRGGGIRTPDPLLPKQMRYQAAPRPDTLRL